MYALSSRRDSGSASPVFSRPLTAVASDLRDSPPGTTAIRVKPRRPGRLGSRASSAPHRPITSTLH